MKKLCILLALSFASLASAATTNNDDSCEIGVVPAATLLLPYFEVDLDDPRGETTIFTITNVTKVDRIARVTLWTDYAFPVLTFNVPLNAYGMQSISLYDVIARGVLPQHSTGTCTNAPLTSELVAYMKSAFLEGTVPTILSVQGCNNVGYEHDNAVGYATVDLVSNCSTNNPFAEKYWTEDIAYDNVLIGDSQQVSAASQFAQGSPMVHVRAIPEGGTPAGRMANPKKYGSHFIRTFYGHYQPLRAPTLDGRQPLPSVFAARWISGGPTGFTTFFKVWREGKTGPGVTCATHDDNITKILEAVIFDERENAAGAVPTARICTPITTDPTLPATSSTAVGDTEIYPTLGNGAVGGWMYLNLDNCTADAPASSSNWVITSMRAEGRYSVDMDAPAFSNGCTLQTPVSEVTTGTQIIGPYVARNPNVTGPANPNWNPKPW